MPLCDRSLKLPRTDVAPVWTRSWPIAKEPTTLGQHLKKKRFMAALRQAQTARILKVSSRTLSLWECDRIYPAWAFQPRLIAYGRRPFEGHGYQQPPRQPVNEDTLKTAEVQIEQKIFTFTLKENLRGRFLRVTEDAGSKRNTIIVPSTGLDDFKRVVNEMFKAAEKLPAPAKIPVAEDDSIGNH